VRAEVYQFYKLLIFLCLESYKLRKCCYHFEWCILSVGNMIYDKITSRRTIRKYEPKDVPEEVLSKCVDAARLSPSSANRQPLKYIIVNDQMLLREVFSTLRWAGYLSSYQPSEEEMPRAYVVIVLDKSIRKNHGRERLRKILNVPDGLDIVLVVALGYPAENPVVDRVKDGNIKYWLDGNGVLHVPKRDLKDIAKWNKF